MVEAVGRLEALNRPHLLHPLQLQPARAQLPLQEGAPKHQPKQHLILRDCLLVKDQVERELALEIQSDIVNVLRVFLDERLLREIMTEGLGLKCFNPVNLVEHSVAIQPAAHFLLGLIVRG